LKELYISLIRGKKYSFRMIYNQLIQNLLQLYSYEDYIVLVIQWYKDYYLYIIIIKFSINWDRIIIKYCDANYRLKHGSKIVFYNEISALVNLCINGDILNIDFPDNLDSYNVKRYKIKNNANLWILFFGTKYWFINNII